jgi:hypothetical protein
VRELANLSAAVRSGPQPSHLTRSVNGAYIGSGSATSDWSSTWDCNFPARAFCSAANVKQAWMPAPDALSMIA